jgi:hypothetical protein
MKIIKNDKAATRAASSFMVKSTMAKLSNLLPSAVHATEALVVTLAMFCSTFTGLG